MFIDEIMIQVESGKGGDGVEHWKAGKERGPDGGNGGMGGDVYIEAKKDLSTLGKYIHMQHLKAEDGDSGRGQSRTGKSAQDLILYVPIGTIITNTITKEQFSLLKNDDRVLVAAGGEGGFGNEHFKGSKNTSPRITTKGIQGQSYLLKLDLLLIANAGLIGLPSAGKSSILNVLTNAGVKTASYHFTTLEPNLGEFNGYILADIPGLIEGASAGKGLGIKFLKQLSRTTLLIHCISLESEDIIKEYKIIRSELLKFNKELGEKKEILLLTKTDLVTPKIVEEKIKLFEQECYTISIFDDEAIKNFSKRLSQILSE